MTKPTKWPVSPAKTDQTRRIPRLIWFFAGRTGDFVGFVLPYLWHKVFVFRSTLTQQHPESMLSRMFTESQGKSHCQRLICQNTKIWVTSALMTEPTKWHVCPAKTQISLGIRPVWSEPSLSAWRKLWSLATHWVHSKDSDQTGQMPRLTRVFAGHTVILLVLSWGGPVLVCCCTSLNI